MGFDFGDVDMDEEEMDEYEDERGFVDDDDWFEDAAAVAEAENELEIAAETIDLPIHSASERRGEVDSAPLPASEDALPTTSVEPTTMESTPATAPKLRSKKSMRFSKGGAFNAHQFSKSLQKGGQSTSPETKE